jgi:hypothetical protein
MAAGTEARPIATNACTEKKKHRENFKHEASSNHE